jgi:3-deoxy-manno-octulosonate cytidylyltransferase (CMP-KDO synthetase)
MDKAGYALYFSRAPIAWDRDANAHNNLNFSSYAYYYRHVGLYAYRASAIKHYMNLPESYLERMESLEQLRVLWHGGRIHVDAACETMPPGVDTLADLHLVSDQLKNL